MSFGYWESNRQVEPYKSIPISYLGVICSIIHTYSQRIRAHNSEKRVERRIKSLLASGCHTAPVKQSIGSQGRSLYLSPSHPKSENSQDEYGPRFYDLKLVH